MSSDLDKEIEETETLIALQVRKLVLLRQKNAGLKGEASGGGKETLDIGSALDIDMDTVSKEVNRVVSVQEGQSINGNGKDNSDRGDNTKEEAETLRALKRLNNLSSNLANERTLLAFTRTALALLRTVFAFMSVKVAADVDWTKPFLVDTMSIVCVFMMVVGIARHYKVFNT